MTLKAKAQDWLVTESNPGPDRSEALGSKLLIGNGYLGYRGTLEEYGKAQLVACTLSGVYDKRGDAWREPVNAPNGLLVRLYHGKKLLSPLEQRPLKHSQSLDFRHGLHRRETVFSLGAGKKVTVKAERFASMADVHLLALRYSVTASHACTLTLQAGIDADVWDINGPHIAGLSGASKGSLLLLSARTNEGKIVNVAEACVGLPHDGKVRKLDQGLVRELTLKLAAGQTLEFEKFAAVYSSVDKNGANPKTAWNACDAAAEAGYDAALSATQKAWEKRWADSDVQVQGDAVGQHALRYSIYHLLCIAPQHSDKASIPARGLSGQVYKGAIFWDTEMFMLPFFNATQPALARNLVQYRFHTLAGARRKAAGLGYRGAFYAWESKETGDDACTLFNITDVITNRPLRTYFADKQVHISGDVAYGVWQYYLSSGDLSVLVDGGAEVVFECARFFLSWSYFNQDKGRYEVLDVTGPDEYHERVHNNAFSSGLAKHTVGIALKTAELLKKRAPGDYARIAKKIGLAKDLAALKDLHARFYVPQPDPKTKVIEQFTGYHRLEDVSIKDLKKRMLDPHEYLGGGQGIATTTKVIKQADVMTLLHVLGGGYSAEVKKANWAFYEPRTEHGSSLSACIYALVASAVGNSDWGYRYFLKTATVDLTGDAKQYVGSLYIGGTHPAANGGAWMAAVNGFGGLSLGEDGLSLKPSLPKQWKSLAFRVALKGQWVSVVATPKRVTVTADAANRGPISLTLKGRKFSCRPGARVSA